MSQPKRRTIVITTVVLVFAVGVSTLSRGEQGVKTRIDIQKLFTASGWMGDGEYGRKYIDFAGSSTENPHSPPTCIKITYTFGAARWAGIYWQNRPDNWGDSPGNDYSKRGFSRLTFWARGKTGTEVVEFKAGGIENSRKKYHDSFEVTLGRVTLTREWKQYQIDLSGADLSSTIGGFCWVASADYNPGAKMTFFLDDILLE
jgi:hypothetical protein